MKAFLLAAGHGTRLRPLTDSVPKCLLPVQGIPMLDLWLQLLQHHGVSEVLITLHALPPAVHSHFARHPPCLPVRLMAEEVLLGSAGTLLHHRAWLENDPNFWVCYADVLTNCDLGRLARHHADTEAVATLGLYPVPEPQRCGIAEVGGGRILRFEEKPLHPISNLAFSGVMIASTQVLDHIPARIGADIGFDLLPALAGRMAYVELDEFVLDIGSLENYDLAQRSWPGMARFNSHPTPGSEPRRRRGHRA